MGRKASFRDTTQIDRIIRSSRKSLRDQRAVLITHKAFFRRLRSVFLASLLPYFHLQRLSVNCALQYSLHHSQKYFNTKSLYFKKIKLSMKKVKINLMFTFSRSVYVFAVDLCHDKGFQRITAKPRRTADNKLYIRRLCAHAVERSRTASHELSRALVVVGLFV